MACDGRFVELAVAYSTLTDTGGSAAGGITQADAERILDSIYDSRKLVELLVLELLDNARSQHKDFVKPRKPWSSDDETQMLLARYPSVLPVMPLPPSQHPPLVFSQESPGVPEGSMLGARGAERVSLTHASSWQDQHLVQDAGSPSDGP